MLVTFQSAVESFNWLRRNDPTWESIPEHAKVGNYHSAHLIIVSTLRSGALIRGSVLSVGRDLLERIGSYVNPAEMRTLLHMQRPTQKGEGKVFVSGAANQWTVRSKIASPADCTIIDGCVTVASHASRAVPAGAAGYYWRRPIRLVARRALIGRAMRCALLKLKFLPLTETNAHAAQSQISTFFLWIMSIMTGPQNADNWEGKQGSFIKSESKDFRVTINSFALTVILRKACTALVRTLGLALLIFLISPVAVYATDITVGSFQINNFNRSGTTAQVRIWYSANFVDSNGVPVLGGAVGTGSIYKIISCTLNPSTHILSIPSFTLPSTNDSSVPNVRATALIFDSSGARVTYLFTNWIIPYQLGAGPTFAQLSTYNAASPVQPAPSYPTTDQVLVLINSAVGTLNDASTTVKGRTKLSVAPVLSSNPIAIGDNDPRLSSLGQNITNVVLAPYLADNTGAADASAAIQQAINDGKKRIYLPTGTYLMGQTRITSTAQLINYYSGGDDVEIFGDGTGKTIITVPPIPSYNAGDTTIINMANGSRQSIHDISFRGNNAPASGHVNVIAADQSAFKQRIYNVEISGWGDGTTAGAGLITTYQPYYVNDLTTILGTTITAGTRTVTPGSMNGIYRWRLLVLNYGGGNFENIVVTAVTATTFTAVFVNAHNASERLDGWTNSVQNATIENFDIHDCPRATGITMNSGGNVIKNGTIKRVGTNNNQHGLYVQAGQSSFRDVWIEGVSGYGIHQYSAHTQITEESGNVYDRITVIDPGFIQVLIEGQDPNSNDISNGVNPLYPAGTPLSRYTVITNSTFRTTEGGNPSFGYIDLSGPTKFIGNTVDGAINVRAIKSPYTIVNNNTYLNGAGISPGAENIGGVGTSQSSSTGAVSRTLYGMSAASSAPTYTAGGDLHIGAGIGSKKFTVISNTAGAVAVTILFTGPGDSTFIGNTFTLTSGVDFTLGSDNTTVQLAVTAANLQNAINSASSTLYQNAFARAGSAALGESTADVFVSRGQPTAGLTLSTNQAGRISVMQAADGNIILHTGISNSDTGGVLTIGGGGTVTYNFSKVYETAPRCFVNDTNATPAAVGASASTTVLTVTGTAGHVVNYFCVFR